MIDHSRPEIEHKINPKEYLNQEAQNRPPFSICEVHRRLWRMADKLEDQELAAKFKALIEVGYDMGKRMDLRLNKLKKA